MRLPIVRGQKTTFTGDITCYRLYGYRTPDNQFTADFIIELDHDGLIELIRKAETNKSKRTKDGPVVVKLSDIVRTS